MNSDGRNLCNSLHCRPVTWAAKEGNNHTRTTETNNILQRDISTELISEDKDIAPAQTREHHPFSPHFCFCDVKTAPSIGSTTNPTLPWIMTEFEHMILSENSPVFKRSHGCARGIPRLNGGQGTQRACRQSLWVNPIPNSKD